MGIEAQQLSGKEYMYIVAVIKQQYVSSDSVSAPVRPNAGSTSLQENRGILLKLLDSYTDPVKHQ